MGRCCSECPSFARVRALMEYSSTIFIMFYRFSLDFQLENLHIYNAKWVTWLPAVEEGAALLSVERAMGSFSEEGTENNLGLSIFRGQFHIFTLSSII